MADIRKTIPLPNNLRADLAIRSAECKSESERVKILQGQLSRRDARLAKLQDELEKERDGAAVLRGERETLRGERDVRDQRLQTLAEQIKRREERILKLEEKASAFDYGVPLPPRKARYFAETMENEGSRSREDDYYIQTADADAARFAEGLDIQPGSSVLDVGCGPGRVAIGLMRRFGDDISYTGVDVKADRIQWANDHLSRWRKGYKFLLLDVTNERYNPKGEMLTSDFTFPFEESSFDDICLFSVFTHMRSSDIAVYLREFYRILKDGGRVFATAFLEDDVPEEEENPPNYLGQEWSGPLHCVLFERSFFYEQLALHGFRVDYEDPQQSYQRHLYLTKIPDQGGTSVL